MNKKSRFRAGLSFGIVMTIIYVLQDLLTGDNHTTSQIIKSIVAGLIGGMVAGFLFGWIIGLFSNSKFVKQATKIDIEPDENIVFETSANHFKGIEGVGGKLYLTNKRLVFKSHKLNIQNHQFSILLTEIQNFDWPKTFRLLNNGLSITSSAGKTEKFVVEEVEEWRKLLTDRNGFQQAALR